MVVTHRARAARSFLPRRTLRVPCALSILVVDDDPGLRELIGLKLVHAGYEVKPAADGWSALDEIAIQRPDLAILDINMPGMSGLEVCRRLRLDPRTAAVPIILLGASTDDERSREAAAAGADRYLVKPFGLRSILDEIAALLPGPGEAA